MNERILTILIKNTNTPLFQYGKINIIHKQKFVFSTSSAFLLPRVSFNQRAINYINYIDCSRNLFRSKLSKSIDTYMSVVSMDCITPVMQPKMIDCPGRSRAWHFASRDPSHGPPGRRPGAFVPNIAELLGRQGYTRVCTRDFCAWNNVRGQLAGVRTRGEPRGEETNWLHGCLDGNNGVLSFAWKTIEITNWITRALPFSPDLNIEIVAVAHNEIVPYWKIKIYVFFFWISLFNM